MTMYLKIPLRYLKPRHEAKQGVEWWDRAVAGLLEDLAKGNHVGTWAVSFADLNALTPESAIIEEAEVNS